MKGSCSKVKKFSSVTGNFSVKSTRFYAITKNIKLADDLHVSLIDFDKNSRCFRKQLKDKRDAIYLKNALSNLKDCTPSKVNAAKKNSKNTNQPHSSFSNSARKKICRSNLTASDCVTKKSGDISSSIKGISTKKKHPKERILKGKFEKKNRSNRKKTKNVRIFKENGIENLSKSKKSKNDDRVTFKTSNLFNNVGTHSHASEGNEMIKKPHENGGSNISSEFCSAHNSAIVIDSTFQKRSRKKKVNAAKSVDTLNVNRRKRKADSVVSTESKGLYNGEINSLIKVTDIKSLVSLKEKRNKNIKKEKSSASEKRPRKEKIIAVKSVDTLNVNRRKRKANSIVSTESKVLYNGETNSLIKVTDIKYLVNLKEKRNKTIKKEKSSASEKRPRKEKIIAVKSVDTLNLNRRKRKADSVVSTESKALYKGETNSLLKVTDVKSLVNLKEKRNKNLKKGKSSASEKRSRKEKVIAVKSVDTLNLNRRKRKADSIVSTELKALYNGETNSLIKMTDIKSLINLREKRNKNLTKEKNTTKKRSRKEKVIAVESVDTLNVNRRKRKADSIISAESKTLYNGKTNYLIKVTDIKSLVNLKEKNENLKKGKNSAPESREEKKSKKKSSHSLQDKKSYASEFELQETKNLPNNPLLKLNSDKKTIEAKRKLKSADSNADYKVRTPTTKKDLKSQCCTKQKLKLSKKCSLNKHMRCKKDTAISQSHNSNVTFVESEDLPSVKEVPEHVTPIIEGSELVPSTKETENFNQSCSVGPVHQITNVSPVVNFGQNIVNFTLNDFNSRCKILYNSEKDKAYLAIPLSLHFPFAQNVYNVESETPQLFQFQDQNFPVTPLQYMNLSHIQSPTVQQRNLQYPAIIHNVFSSENNVPAFQKVPSVFAPQYTHNVFSGENNVPASQKVPSVFEPQYTYNIFSSENNVPASQKISSVFVPQIDCNIKPQTSSSSPAVYSDNLNSTNIHSSSNSLNSACLPVRTYMPKIRSIQFKQATQRNCVQKLKYEQPISFDWQFFVKNNTMDTQFFDEIPKHFRYCTVRDFCTNPFIVNELSKENIPSRNESRSRIEYHFRDIVLDQPFLSVLKDFVEFHMEDVYEEIKGKTGKSLILSFSSEVNLKFPLPMSKLFEKMWPPKELKDVDINYVISAFSLVGIIYIFQYYHKLEDAFK